MNEFLGRFHCVRQVRKRNPERAQEIEWYHSDSREDALDAYELEFKRLNGEVVEPHQAVEPEDTDEVLFKYEEPESDPEFDRVLSLMMPRRFSLG